jgi:hypothetical protein
MGHLEVMSAWGKLEVSPAPGRAPGAEKLISLFQRLILVKDIAIEVCHGILH